MHPRFEHFPWQADYADQPNIFAPHVMALAAPEYRSKSVTIDALGFRDQYDAEGTRIDLSRARDTYESCTVLLGNSTSFGVSLSENRKTLNHYFHRDRSPCINLSVRGAMMQQELALLQNFKHLLPRIERIILLTGICDVSLATQPEHIFSSSLGGMQAADYYQRQFFKVLRKYPGLTDRSRQVFLRFAESLFYRYRPLRKFFEYRYPAIAPGAIEAALFHQQLLVIFKLIRNVLESWAWMQRGANIPVSVVLQPILGWTQKSLTEIERACLDADLERIPALSLYVNSAVYRETRQVFETTCRELGIAFIDANPLYDNPAFANETLFTDICHLTDRGTEILAQSLKRSLWP